MGHKILNIGLPRTGTFSLAVALHKLNYKVIHCPKSIDLIDRYDAACEITFSYDDLFYKYPNSFFILTNRQFDFWINSCKKHAVKYNKYWNNDFWKYPDKWADFYLQKIQSIQFFKDYEKFLILNVEDENKLEKLCNFLKLPIPNFEYPHLNKSYKLFI